MYPELQTEINKLNSYQNDYISLAERVIKVYDANTHSIALLALAAINRSISNVKGFITLLKEDNYLLVNSVVRLQLDTLLRFFALNLVKTPEEFADKILDGERIRNIKDSNGKKMTDQYLYETFYKTEKLPWIKNVYEHSSGFIHFGRTHILAIINHDSSDPSHLSIAIGKDGGNAVPHGFKMESIQCMNHITQMLLTYLKGWVLTKEIVEENPDQIKESAHNL